MSRRSERIEMRLEHEIERRARRTEGFARQVKKAEMAITHTDQATGGRGEACHICGKVRDAWHMEKEVWQEIKYKDGAPFFESISCYACLSCRRERAENKCVVCGICSGVTDRSRLVYVGGGDFVCTGCLSRRYDRTKSQESAILSQVLFSAENKTTGASGGNIQFANMKAALAKDELSRREEEASIKWSTEQWACDFCGQKGKDYDLAARDVGSEWGCCGECLDALSGNIVETSDKDMYYNFVTDFDKAESDTDDREKRKASLAVALMSVEIEHRAETKINGCIDRILNGLIAGLPGNRETLRRADREIAKIRERVFISERDRRDASRMGHE